jgi:hypothetical protein
LGTLCTTKPTPRPTSSRASWLVWAEFLRLRILHPTGASALRQDRLNFETPTPQPAAACRRISRHGDTFEGLADCVMVPSVFIDASDGHDDRSHDAATATQAEECPLHDANRTGATRNRSVPAQAARGGATLSGRSPIAKEAQTHADALVCLMEESPLPQRKAINYLVDRYEALRIASLY